MPLIHWSTKMIEDGNARGVLSRAFGEAINELVRERLNGVAEEPDITSRIGQRLEDMFNGHQRGGYKIRVLTETIPSHGGGSLEKPLGADLYMLFEAEDASSRKVTKAVFVQAKRGNDINKKDLAEQCRRMNLVTIKGSVVWTYLPSGVLCQRAIDVQRNRSNVFGIETFFDSVLECKIGDKRKIPNGHFGNRPALKDMLKTIGAKNAVWLKMQKA